MKKLIYYVPNKLQKSVKIIQLKVAIFRNRIIKNN